MTVLIKVLMVFLPTSSPGAFVQHHLDHYKKTVKTPSKNALDALILTAGMLLGALLGMTLLWIWLDYRQNPAGSWLAVSSLHLAQLFPAGARTYLECQFTG